MRKGRKWRASLEPSCARISPFPPLLATSSRRQRTIRRTMSDRLTSRMLTSALIRRAGQEGGFATILRKGDEVAGRSEEHTSELQSLMRTSYAVFCLKKKMIHNISKSNHRIK